MASFEFNAPQFVNFSQADDPKADRFFDTNQDSKDGRIKQIINSVSKTKESFINDEANTENEVPSSTVKVKEPPSTKKNFTVFRKVLHEIVNHQIQSDKKDEVVEKLEGLQLCDDSQKQSKGPLRATEIFNGVKLQEIKSQSHSTATKMNSLVKKSSSSSLNSEGSSDNYVSSTSCNYFKSTSMKRNASPLNSARKFISLAEQVEHFYKDTPERYRSKPTKPATPIRKNWAGKTNCIPKTPTLVTKYRQRKVNYPDEKQREEMELEEIKKHQIKALPLNEKILMGPCLNLKAPIVKKPVTVPQPFSLTEVKKKEPPAEPVFQFKAQAVPTAILNGCVGIPPKKVDSPTIPVTPKIKVPARLRVEVKSVEKTSSQETLTLPRKTKIEPFSFDARMRDLLQKKEEFVKKVIEEEKKSFNFFKAHPMPDFKMKNECPGKSEKTPHKTVPQPFNLTQVKGNKSVCENPLGVSPFRARPAAVIHQKPFQPKLHKHEIHTPSEFYLNTEKRAAERHKFDEKIKEKEEKQALLLKLQKEEEERLEKEKKLEERKKTEFKAMPVPRYKVFEIHGSDPEKLTLPRSPAFSYKTKKSTA